MLERHQLKADHMYYLWERKEENGTYFYTPDGVGGYWYDTEEEMFEQHGVGSITESEVPAWF